MRQSYFASSISHRQHDCAQVTSPQWTEHPTLVTQFCTQVLPDAPTPVLSGQLWLLYASRTERWQPARKADVNLTNLSRNHTCNSLHPRPRIIQCQKRTTGKMSPLERWVMGTDVGGCWHYKGRKFQRRADFSLRKITVIDFRKSDSSFQMYGMNIHVKPRCMRASWPACPCILFESGCTFTVFFMKIICIQHSILLQTDVLHSPYCLQFRQH